MESEFGSINALQSSGFAVENGINKPQTQSIGTALLNALDWINDFTHLSNSIIERAEKIIKNHDNLFPPVRKHLQRDLYLKAKSEITDLEKLRREINLDFGRKYPILYETDPGNKTHYCMMKVFVQIIGLMERKFSDVWYDIITFAFDMRQMHWYANIAKFPICNYIPNHGPDFEHLKNNKNPQLAEMLRRV